MEQPQQPQQSQQNHGHHHSGENNQQSSPPATPKKKSAPAAKKRNYKKDGIIFKEFSDEEIDTLEEIGLIQNKTVEELLLEVLKPQVTTIVENFQKAKQELLMKAAADSFKGVKK